MIELLEKAAADLRTARGDAERLAAAMTPVREAGLYDLALAARWGGGGATLAEVVETVRQAARIDGSLGFLLSQSALGHLITAGFPEVVLADMHSTRPAAVAGAFAPKGRATREGAAWRVTGRWPLATGAVLADHLYLQCIVAEGRRVLTSPDGAPVTIIVLVPAGRVRIERTWNAPGLAETASDDVIARGVAVPENWAGTVQHAPGGNIASIPARPFPAADLAGLPIAAVAVGVAEGLLAEVARLGREGRRSAFQRTPMADASTARRDLGTAAMGIEAAAALLDRAASGGFGSAREGRARSQAAPAAVVRLCLDAADLLHSLAGSAALDRDRSVARQVADLRTLALHAWAGDGRVVALGGLLMGGEVDAALLPRDGSGGDERDDVAGGQSPKAGEPGNAGTICD